jgi:hypothetical protein
MHKRLPRPRRLLLDTEIIKILTATDKVGGGRMYTPSNPPENCVNTSQRVHDC